MKKHIYIIAGEKSGDIIGANIISSLLQIDSNLFFSGIGGEAMIEAGMTSLFDYNDLAVMGVSDVLSSYSRIRERIAQTVTDIKSKQPDIIITIDAQGFSKRIAKFTVDLNIPKVHIVAPTVWAWRAGRVHTYKKLFNRVLCLFPFEPQYFNDVGLPADFVGHPCVDMLTSSKNNAEKNTAKSTFFKRHNMAETTTKIGLMAGSRRGEVMPVLDCYISACKKMEQQGRDIHILAPVVPSVKKIVDTALKKSGLKYSLVEQFEKQECFDVCDVALATSGTITLELAISGVPMVVGYKASWLSYHILRHFIKIKYFSLPNIILGNRGFIPEFLQANCNEETLFNALVQVIDTDFKSQKKAFSELKNILKSPDLNGKATTMGQCCAMIILDELYDL